MRAREIDQTLANFATMRRDQFVAMYGRPLAWLVITITIGALLL